MKSKADRSLCFRSLQELRNLESKFITTTTTLQSTLRLIDSLEMVGRTLNRRPFEALDQCLEKAHDLGTEADCKELQALAAYSLKCQAFLASVEVMQSRVGRLVELVFPRVLDIMENAAPVNQSVACGWP